MARKLNGVVCSGVGNAVTWPTAVIRKITQRPKLHEGTLNVLVRSAHEVTPHYTLPQTMNNRSESLYFERCDLILGNQVVPALIARTSTNYHGSQLLEIMADVHLRDVYGIVDGDEIVVEIQD